MLLLRKTSSKALYAQQVGRALRSFPGKAHGLVIDVAGNSAAHGAAGPGASEARAELLTTGQDRRAARAGRGRAAPPFS